MKSLKAAINVIQTYIAVILLVLGPNYMLAFQKNTRTGPAKPAQSPASEDTFLREAYDNERRKLILVSYIVSSRNQPYSSSWLACSADENRIAKLPFITSFTF